MIPLFKVAMSQRAVDAAAAVLNSGFIGQGPVVEKFERALEGLTHMPVVTTSSCTSAIEMILTYLGVGPGDEIITTPLTCIASNAPIVHLGARPVWADVDHRTGNISPFDIEKKITPRTKAIIAVDWTGRRADYWAIRQVAKNIPIIQDAAHGPAFAHSPRDRGDFICSSYGPIKHLTSGDGGSIATFDARARAAFKLLRWYGLDRESSTDFRCSQDIVNPGMKWHMTDLNAAIGLGNLPDLARRLEVHQSNSLKLYQSLNRLKNIALPLYDNSSNYWVFPILVLNGQRDVLKKHLHDQGIESSQVHARNDKHTGYDYPNGPLPGLDLFDAMQLNIPCGWWVSEQDRDKMVEAIREWNP